MTLRILNDLNTQKITLVGLTDDTNAKVSSATITGTLRRNGSDLATLNFTASATPGNYEVTLNGFDAPAGVAELRIAGTNSGATFNRVVPVYIEEGGIDVIRP